MDELGIPYTTLMPIPTSLKSVRSQAGLVHSVAICGCDPSYYLPHQLIKQKTITPADIKFVASMSELYLDTQVDATTAHYFSKLDGEQKKRFDPMITGLHIGSDDCSNMLLDRLDRYPDVFTGVGEITVHKEVVDALIRGEWANLESNIRPLLQLLYACGRIGMPVVLHCDVTYPSEGPEESPKYLEGIQKLLSHPFAGNTTVIWAHGGGLGRFVNAPGAHVKTLRGMLENPALSKLHIDISWTVVADKLMANDNTSKEWRALIDDFSDRFIFGSDTLAPQTSDIWNQTYKKYSDLRNALAENTVKKVFLENYERVFVEAREKVRAYERNELQLELEKLQIRYRPIANASSSSTTTTSLTTATTASEATSTTSVKSTDQNEYTSG
jgi:hypothetical protein